MNMHLPNAESLYHILRDQIHTTYGDSLYQPDGVALVGIWSGGAWLAERLAHDLKLAEFGVVSVVLHRDDYAEKGLHGQARPTSLPFQVEGRRIVLLDDVLYTGRTIRAALNELYDFGRPAAVDLAVLVDRGGRELPIAARFVGVAADLPADRTLVLGRHESGLFEFHSETRTD